MLAALLCVACPKGGDEAPPPPFADDFNRPALGERYRKGGGSWRIVDGTLSSVGDHNQPLWLDVPLAKNVKVEFTAWSRSPAVDTKIEIFGDGVRHESGYIVILGGWQNTVSTIARLDEHERGRVELRGRWEKDRRYRWTVQRTDGHTLELLLDGERILAYDDKDPLFGPRNDRLAFTSWESEVSYDDLVITPLP
ncbi:MAG: hypothetical protein IT382_24460 [Deltaproteobacteria bacterium]|nr:hypothetical protein [Deltaproteobacteria bacterium]